MASTYAVVLLVGIILGQNYAEEQGNKPGNSLVPIGLSNNSYKTQQVIDLVYNSYVDSLDLDSLENGAINHIVSHLDPYSSYLLPLDTKKQTEVLEGTFEGIGMEYFNLNDTLLVVSLINGGPAEKAGFRVGDRLLRIDNKVVAGVNISKEEIEKLIRGKSGTAAHVFIKRKNEIQYKPLIVVRNQIKVSSLDVAYMVAPTIAYIKIRRFGVSTAEEFKAALKELKKQGAKQLVLDLRDNGGGYFHVAIKLASEFFEDRRLIVYTEGAHEERLDYFSTEKGDYARGNLAVLINEHTASASEIVAGAVQDWDRGVIIGRRSYGKGIVQEQFDFSDGSMINLSIARYYTPLGRSIQKKYSANWSNMLDFNTMYKGLWKVDTLYAHGQSFKTMAGKEVFSGGGILPDVQIPIDSNEISILYNEILNSSFIEQFVYARFTQALPAYSIENFLQGYHLPDKEYHEFINFNRQRGIVISERKKVDLRKLIETNIEALVGRYYFGREAYFKVKNRNDIYLQKALNHFSPSAGTRVVN